MPRGRSAIPPFSASGCDSRGFHRATEKSLLNDVCARLVCVCVCQWVQLYQHHNGVWQESRLGSALVYLLYCALLVFDLAQEHDKAYWQWSVGFRVGIAGAGLAVLVVETLSEACRPWW